MQLKHWQTTALGILVILLALAHAGAGYITGTPVDWTSTVALLGAGGGLIRGADASKVNEVIQQLKGK